MLLMPGPGTAIVDPFAGEPTVSFVCEIGDPLTFELYTRDPRPVARRAEAYLETGVAHASYFGPECEFFVFDSISYSLEVNGAHYHVDSGEGHWNAGEPGLGYKLREKGGYFPVAPHDTLSDLRTQSRSSRVTVTPASWRSRAPTSLASSPTRPRCSHSARRRQARSAGSCRAARLRSASSSRLATARPPSACRCTPARRASREAARSGRGGSWGAERPPTQSDQNPIRKWQM